MKTYILEPTYKKSIAEVELWRKSDTILPTDDNDENWYTSWNGPVLRKECWWRWGEFTIQIPETKEESDIFLNEKGFETLEAYLEYHGIIDHGDEDENDRDEGGYNTKKDGATHQKNKSKKSKPPSIEDVLLPDEDEDEHVLPPEAECNYCWDGQGEEFTIATTRNSRNITDEEKKEMRDEATRVYGDEGMYEEGLEMLGWEHYSTIYEVYCTMTATLQESESEKKEREWKEFQMQFLKDLKASPETLGNLFETKNDNDSEDGDCNGNGVLTVYKDAVEKFGTKPFLEKVHEILFQSGDTRIQCDDAVVHLPPYMVAASCSNCELDVIYFLLRKSPSLEGYL